MVPSLYGFSVAQLRNDNTSCCRHAKMVRGPAPEACRHIIGRCHVALHGRPSSSFDCQQRNSAVRYIGNCAFRLLENSLFYDPHISHPLTFRSRFCHKFCDLYASIYGTCLAGKLAVMWHWTVCNYLTTLHSQLLWNAHCTVYYVSLLHVQMCWNLCLYIHSFAYVILACIILAAHPPHLVNIN